MCEHDESVMATFEVAESRMPVLTREIFLLCRLDDLSIVEISRRLCIDYKAVQACLAEGLVMVSAMLHGEAPGSARSAAIESAERALRQRHRAYCEQVMHASGKGGAIIWDDDRDDDKSVVRAKLAAMPACVLEVFVLNRVEGLSYAQIARRQRTFTWVIKRRMLRAIRAISRGPMTFEIWLREQSI